MWLTPIHRTYEKIHGVGTSGVEANERGTSNTSCSMENLKIPGWGRKSEDSGIP